MIIRDRVRRFTVALTLGVLLIASPTWAEQGGATASAGSVAQQAGIQAALANDVGTLSDKFVGLAKAMTGKYDWRPGQGVRSVGDVFNPPWSKRGLPPEAADARSVVRNAGPGPGSAEGRHHGRSDSRAG
jgi:hypothetical protein